MFVDDKKIQISQFLGLPRFLSICAAAPEPTAVQRWFRYKLLHFGKLVARCGCICFLMP